MSSTSPSRACANGSCVNVEKIDGGVLLTSTIPGNEGYVRYTDAEWVTFVAEVKAERWDHTL